MGDPVTRVRREVVSFKKPLFLFLRQLQLGLKQNQIKNTCHTDYKTRGQQEGGLWLCPSCTNMIARLNPTNAPSIWKAQKWQKAGAKTQNLRHRDKTGCAGVVQARVSRRRVALIGARLIKFIYFFMQGTKVALNSNLSHSEQFFLLFWVKYT